MENIDANRRRKGEKMKNVQIPYELFMLLIRHYLVEDDTCLYEIRQGLEKKLDSSLIPAGFHTNKYHPPPDSDG